MIVCSFDNYNLLSNNATGTDFQIVELSEVIAAALGIKNIAVKEEYTQIKEKEDQELAQALGIEKV